MGPRPILTVPRAIRPTRRRISTSTAWSASAPRESSHGSARAGAPSPTPNEPTAVPPSNLDAVETGIVLTPPTLLPFPNSTYSSSIAPVRAPAFSTSRFVTALERRSGGTLGRGVSTAIMEVTRDILMKEEGRVASESWRRGDLENETYLFKAALAELKSSYQIRARNDSVVLRSLTASLQRDTDAISQRLKEDTASLRSSIQLEMHVRKEESNADLKALDRAIMDLTSKFTILLGEARTEQESVKWVSTRRVLGALVILIVGVVVAVTLPKPGASGNEGSGDPPATPTVESLGVTRRDGTEADVSANWFWPHAGRVGEADEPGEGETAAKGGASAAVGLK